MFSEEELSHQFTGSEIFEASNSIVIYFLEKRKGQIRKKIHFNTLLAVQAGVGGEMSNSLL